MTRGIKGISISDIMYGLVNKAVEEMVKRGFGPEAWEQVKAKANVEEAVFISNEPYPDELTFRLVHAASEVTGIKPDDILFSFGEHWITHTSRHGYGALMDAGGKSLPEFLINLPHFHTRIAMIFPKLRPPEFKADNVKPNSLELHYFSERSGLTPFVHGLLSGLGKKFDKKLTSHLQQSKSLGADHDIFLVEWAD